MCVGGGGGWWRGREGEGEGVEVPWLRAERHPWPLFVAMLLTGCLHAVLVYVSLVAYKHGGQAADALSGIPEGQHPAQCQQWSAWYQLLATPWLESCSRVFYMGLNI